jgi:hypothetical protein
MGPSRKKARTKAPSVDESKNKTPKQEPTPENTTKAEASSTKPVDPPSNESKSGVMEGPSTPLKNLKAEDSVNQVFTYLQAASYKTDIQIA